MRRWLWWLGAAALLACALPWVVNPGAGLSLNPVDLAEWTSLNPTIQNQTPSLLTTFLLRTPLLVVAVLFALAANRSTRPLAALLVVVLAAAQLPPFEILSNFSNPNYQQQALLAGLTLVLGLLALIAVPRKHALAAASLTSIAGLAAVLLGASSGLDAMHALGLPALAGPGLILYCAALGLTTALPAIEAGIKKRRFGAPLSVIQ